MKNLNILVIGANSQLGKTLKEFNYLSSFNFEFTTSKELNISNKKAINQKLEKTPYDYCLNFAAYTDVNKAESERKKAFEINAKAVEHLAKICHKNQVVLVHISTDFVFDGKQKTPYIETDATNPLNYYGQSKLLGEKAIQKQLNKYFIIRTSWLYSKYKHNFVKTISKLAQKEENLRIVADQIGTPTYALDLIDFILRLITSPNKKAYGLYHYSNQGTASWYEFGKEIIKNLKIDKSIAAVDSKTFTTIAKRPAYSVLSKEKAIKTFGIQPRHWKKALADFFENKPSNYNSRK